MTQEQAVESFIHDVKAILAEDGSSDGGLGRIAERMRLLVRDEAVVGDDPDAGGNIHTGRQSGPLYSDDDGLVLVRARFGPEEMTPIHNHGSWGVIGVYKGRDRYQVWRCLDECFRPGAANIELVDERVLEQGDVVVLPHPPNDIHAQQGLDGEPAYELVLFGSSVAMTQPRLYFDPEAGTAREVKLR